MRITFDNVSARIAAQEEIIGRGTATAQTAAAGSVIIETGPQGVTFAMTLPEFRVHAPQAVYDPATRRFRDADILDPWTPEG